jgi:alpha-1,3/alpha-1,6-mannosyltransferase
VTIYTPVFDPSHCFQVCLTGQLNIQVINTRIPKFNKGTAFWAYLRMFILTLYVLLFTSHHIYIVDQVSISLPLIRCFFKKVIFYCHFPDKLLCVNRKGYLKRIYRWVIDFIEEFSLRFAHKIIMNSKFT